ncbi:MULTISPECIES: ABC transporter substrate-binding protein [Marinobacter]|jgi:branched-chain amino acid transport system substrate-binding protein|uniref:ABC transporter substrate-binding protein n=1 Tax=Marinobacter TaxID=2742 RepID=UPI00126973D8|nr:MULTISPECIES: ABC transporter substrate-binding protein [unclassified Marinobacter]QFS86761.1 Leucine-, isoleucine-, valine-, threonine-, and alanine-binding protein precursor [Marinobacter sp. THAF197a]QFT50545.1 Leucine-, isoleucine-, valine-, threonine-, and alanine-binding protein precursor [Marinobacter sp. THAF39]WBU42873.1 ABC transporter substrate-binding protein [Marinobacter alkaliphilus]
MSFRNFLLTACLLLLGSSVVYAETLKIGLNYPQTGRYKDQGLQQRLGAFLAVDEINRAGGVMGQPLELVIRNSRGEPDQGAQNTAELIDREGAQMVFGGVSSAVAISSGKAARDRNRLYFGTLTYSNATTGSEGHSHMFREPYNAWMTAKALSQYLNRHHADQNYFYITADYTWGWSVEESVRKFSNTEDTEQHKGVKTPFPRALITDFRVALEQAAESNAEVLMLVLFGDDMVRALNAAYEMGLTKRMQVVVPNLTLGMARQVGPTIMEGVVGAAPWVWNLPYENNYQRGKDFVEAFSSRYEMRPSSSAASAYSIVYQYKAAVERAGSTNTRAVIRELEGHRYSFLKDEQYWRAFDHQNVQTVYVVKVKPREKIMADQFSSDYFDIIDSMPGDEAAQTREEWEARRREAGKPVSL